MQRILCQWAALGKKNALQCRALLPIHNEFNYALLPPSDIAAETLLNAVSNRVQELFLNHFPVLDAV